jgi:hypothetical protein
MPRGLLRKRSQSTGIHGRCYRQRAGQVGRQTLVWRFVDKDGAPSAGSAQCQMARRSRGFPPITADVLVGGKGATPRAPLTKGLCAIGRGWAGCRSAAMSGGRGVMG